jgi:predicted RNase H-like HicB family nuclease
MRKNMKEMDYVVWQEDKYYVSQCLNIDVASFGETFEEAVNNLKEAVELYFENEPEKLASIPEINRIFIGKEPINA